MTPADLLILNFEEIRRRSTKIWESVSPDCYSWRPDVRAMTLQEMVRHVLESEHIYHIILERGGVIGDYISPWTNRPLGTIHDEIEFAQPFREEFLTAIQRFGPEELDSIDIDRRDVGQKSKLGKYLLKAGYHEAVHTGQFLSYLRTLGIKRPVIWD
jgi:uncharacterized damage-inducible protein DinB